MAQALNFSEYLREYSNKCENCNKKILPKYRYCYYCLRHIIGKGKFRKLAKEMSA
jgi:uncharacterized OB-fold protein